jgi:DNA modification methylase
MSYQILVGDCRERLKELPDQSVHCCVTSPPYFNQRDYGVEGQFGLEEKPQDYVDDLVNIFEEVRRVLRDDGTVFLNLGDKYSSGGRRDYGPAHGKQSTNQGSKHHNRPNDGFGPKQLLGIPWRVALALQDNGWYLRSDIIWHKPNAMPSSQMDRPTTNHEYIFLLAKSPEYFYDDFAIREVSASVWNAKKDFERSRPKTKDLTPDQLDRQRTTFSWNTHHDDIDRDTRTKRTVWTIPVAAEAEAHFAVFPPKLPQTCIMAGTSKKGCCPECGAPYERVLEKIRKPTRPGKNTKVLGNSKVEGNRDPQRHVSEVKTKGWAPGCDCDAGKPIPCTVLDPFAGSGTTLSVAIRKKRNAIGIELNPEYADIIRRKLSRAKQKQGFGG